jgi:hypothetical protein
MRQRCPGLTGLALLCFELGSAVSPPLLLKRAPTARPGASNNTKFQKKIDVQWQFLLRNIAASVSSNGPQAQARVC